MDTMTKTKWIEIKNQGEICNNAFILLGATNKRGDDTKIGFFGSGLKYALAVLLRNKIPLKVYPGLKELAITTQKTEFRGLEFNNIYINGEKTSLTLEMGIDWEVWQAIREIYCNAIDEGNSLVKVVEDILPEQDKTSFYIGLTETTEDIINNWNKYFCTNRTDVVAINDDWQVFNPSERFILYRKGIKSLHSVEKSLYDYNINEIEINESRVVKYSWQVYERLAEYWGKFATESMIRNLFDNLVVGHKEYELSWHYAKEFNDAWLKVIDGRLLIHKDVAGYFTQQIQDQDCLILQSSLIKSLEEFYKDRVKVAGQSDSYGKYVTIPMNSKQAFLIKSVNEFFEEVGLKIDYPIEIAIFQDKNVLGRAVDSKIVLSVNVMEMGKKMIASTVLEETLHIESGKKDETRGFQDYIINKMLTILENKNGFFL